MSNDAPPPPPVPTAPASAPAATPAAPAGSVSKNRARLIGWGGVAVGMVLGAVVEMFVQGAMESTGWFGPTLETVVTEQIANFDAIQAKLDALAASKDEAERTRLQAELEKLLEQQRTLTGRTHTELRGFQQEVTDLRAQTLAEQKAVGGADLWLTAGQSVTVGDRGNVFALQAIDAYRRARVNLSGKEHLLKVGEFVEAPVGGATWKVFYKQDARGEDRKQLGFDIVTAER